MTNHHPKTQTEEIITGTHLCDSEWCCMTYEEMDALQADEIRRELASGHVHGGGNPEDAWTAAGQTMELRRLDREAQEQAHREFAIMDRIYTERGMEF